MLEKLQENFAFFEAKPGSWVYYHEEAHKKQFASFFGKVLFMLCNSGAIVTYCIFYFLTGHLFFLCLFFFPLLLLEVHASIAAIKKISQEGIKWQKE